MKHLIKKDFLYVLCNQAILSIGALCIVVILARFTTQEIFGEIRYLIAVLTILSFLSLPGISVVINHRASYMTPEELSALIYIQFKWGIIAMMGGFLIASIHALLGNFELAELLIIGSILSPIANLYLVPGLILAGIKRFFLKALVDLFIITITLLGVTLGALHSPSASMIVFLYYISQAGAALLALYFVFQILRFEKIRKIYSKFTEHIDNGRHLSFLQAPFSLIPAVEKTIVFLILGPVSLATFVIVTLPVEHFKMAFRNLIQFYSLPHLNSKNVGELIHWLGLSIVILTLGTTALVLFINFGMPLLFVEFESVRWYAFVLMLGLIPLPIHIIMVFWIAERQITKISFYTLAVVFTDILFLAGGAFFFGLTGAIIGKVCNELCVACGLMYIDTRHRSKFTQ